MFLASCTEPPLTTVRQPKHQMGRLATEILLQILEGRDDDARIEVKGQLIVRASTAPPKA